MQIYDYLDRMLRLIQIFREKFRDVFEGKNKIYRNFLENSRWIIFIRPTINASPMNMSRCEAFVAPRHLRRMYPERETSWRILTKEMVMALFPGFEGFHAIFTSKV